MPFPAVSNNLQHQTLRRLFTAPNGKAISELASGLGQNGQMIIFIFVNEVMQFSPANLMRGGRSISGWVGGYPEDALRFSVLTGVRSLLGLCSMLWLLGCSSMLRQRSYRL
jgi:hypothetical protein